MKKVLFAIVVILALIMTYFAIFYKPKEKSEEIPTTKEIIVEEKEKIEIVPTEAAIKPEKTEEELAKEKDKEKEISDVLATEDIGVGAGRLAILIDDVGINVSLAEGFDSLQIPLSFAVLPFLAKSREANQYLTSKGYTVILHMPMEGSDAGQNTRTKGILNTTLTEEETIDDFKKALENVGPVRGFNNHMGSVFTADENKMSKILEYGKSRGLFYVDSKTSPRAQGYKLAKNFSIPTAQCVHFLDNSKNVADIEKELITAIKIARKRGKALVIAHYHKNVIEALKNSKNLFEKSGIRLVSIDEILE